MTVAAPDTFADTFADALAANGHARLRRERVRTVQVNVGKLCNQACHHCHVDAGPKRTEIMTAATAERVLDLIDATPSVEVVDITGGAPELCPSFRTLVQRARAGGRRVLVRCNLTVIYEPGMDWLPEFYRAHEVELVCSLPCYTADNVDSQRGAGVFDKSVRALVELGALGYGDGSGGAPLDLVYNPLGATLPPPQAELEARYREELRTLFGIEFRSLLTITNMPIRRFAETLERRGELEDYMGLLVNHFNPTTVDALMCRSMVSVGWDGRLFDCDFNQMLDLAAPGNGHIDSVESFDAFDGAAVATARHCLGCTAGSGSSCGGAIADGGDA